MEGSGAAWNLLDCEDTVDDCLSSLGCGGRGQGKVWFQGSIQDDAPNGRGLHLEPRCRVVEGVVQGYLANKKTPIPLGPP